MAEARMFEFMEPEEIDNLLKAKLAQHTTKKGKWANKVGNLWDERTINIRRYVIYQLLGQGLSRVRIAQELMSRWEVCEKTAYTYIIDAINNLTADCEEYQKKTKDIIKEKLEAIAEDSLAHGDRKSALQAYEQISKLEGLYVTKVDADVKDKVEISFDFGE